MCRVGLLNVFKGSYQKLVASLFQPCQIIFNIIQCYRIRIYTYCEKMK